MFVKRAKVFWNMAANRHLGRRRPVCAYLCLTDACNMNCTYCFIERHRPRRELTEVEWISLIDELAARGTKHVSLMGGEPLLHPFFERIVARLRVHGMYCEAVTNGLLVPQKIAVLTNLDSLTISLDGGPDTNDLCRRTVDGHGVYERVVEAVRCACRAGVTTRLSAVLTRPGIADIDRLLELANQYGLYVAFSPIGNYPKQKDHLIRPLLPSAVEHRQALRRIKELKTKGARILSSHTALDYLIDYPRPYHEIIRRGDPEAERLRDIHCPFGKSVLCVDATGDFYPCFALFNADFFQPMNFKGGIDAAWNHVAELDCVACSCPAVVDWNYTTSMRGALHGVRLTIRQLRQKRRSSIVG